MSYCSFENTAGDLADCIHALYEMDGSETLSHYESNGLNRILEYTNDILDLEMKIDNILSNEEN